MKQMAMRASADIPLPGCCIENSHQLYGDSYKENCYERINRVSRN